MNVFIIQTVIILLLTFIIFYLITYNSALKLEKRISKYSVSSLKDEKLSLMDNKDNIKYIMPLPDMGIVNNIKGMLESLGNVVRIKNNNNE